MAVVNLHPRPQSEAARLVLFRLEKLAERLADRNDYLGVEQTEQALMAARELAALEADARYIINQFKAAMANSGEPK